MEMRACWDAEKQRLFKDISKLCEKEKNKTIAEVKKKQWVSQLQRETCSVLYVVFLQPTLRYVRLGSQVVKAFAIHAQDPVQIPSSVLFMKPLVFDAMKLMEVCWVLAACLTVCVPTPSVNSVYNICECY